MGELKGSSWAVEQTRENHRAVGALYNEVSRAEPDGGAPGAGAVWREGSRTGPRGRDAVWPEFKRGSDSLRLWEAPRNLPLAGPSEGQGFTAGKNRQWPVAPTEPRPPLQPAPPPPGFPISGHGCLPCTFPGTFHLVS